MVSCFAYIGPEILVPFASAIAAVIGGILLFVRHPIQSIKNLFQWFRSSPPDSDKTDEPDEAHSE